MIQELLTYAIVIWAFARTAWFFWKTLFDTKKQTSGCGSLGCGCDMKQSLIKDIEKGKFPQLLK